MTDDTKREGDELDRENSQRYDRARSERLESERNQTTRVLVDAAELARLRRIEAAAEAFTDDECSSVEGDVTRFNARRDALAEAEGAEDKK